jgi:stage III sporulation protein SpoIIIAA
VDDRTGLLGRAKEIAEVRALLDGGARLVTVHGPPGVGKSRLLREVARGAAQATWIDLSPVSTVEAARRGR